MKLENVGHSSKLDDSVSSLSSNSDQETNREGEEASTPKKHYKAKTHCERDSIFNNTAYQAFQILLGISYFVVCLLGVLAHLTNY